MKIVVISDEESAIGGLDSTEIDVLISCGDLYDPAIKRAIDYYRPKLTLAVRGNHDPDMPFSEGIVDLHLKTHSFGGVTFGGFAGSWRYKPRGHHLFDQIEVSSLIRGMPAVDVFVAHNSPARVHERDSETHQGFEGFIAYIDRARPQLFIHGHQHTNQMTVRDTTTIIGVFGERLIHIDS